MMTLGLDVPARDGVQDDVVIIRLADLAAAARRLAVLDQSGRALEDFEAAWTAVTKSMNLMNQRLA